MIIAYAANESSRSSAQLATTPVLPVASSTPQIFNGLNDGSCGRINESAEQGSGSDGGQITLGSSIAIAAFVTPVALFGLVGNTIVLLGFCLPSVVPQSVSSSSSLRQPPPAQRWRRQRRRATSAFVFIATLAICDQLTIIVCAGYDLLPLAVAVGQATGARWSISSIPVVMQAVLLETIQLSVTWSTWLIAAIAYFRYSVVSKPDETLATCCVAKARKFTMGATIIAVLLSIPAFVRFKVEQRRSGNETRYDFQLNEFAGYAVYKVVYSYFIYFTFSYVVPIGLLVALSYKLIASLLKAREISKSIVATPHSVIRARWRQAKVTKVTVAIAIINIVCMAPSFAHAVVREEAGVDSAAFRIVGCVARSLLLVASAIDCILFSFINKSFRHHLKYGAAAAASRASSKLASRGAYWRQTTAAAAADFKRPTVRLLTRAT